MKKRVRKPATKTPARRAAKTAAPRKAEPTPDQIRSRAYEIFLRRGGAHGHEWEDWITAERELRGS